MFPVLIDFEKICRLCFREDDGQTKMTSIYQQQDLEDIVKKCLQIELTLLADAPTKICSTCMISLDSWCKFKALCDNTNDFLQQYAQDKIDSDLMFNSEMSNLGTLGFTPSQMSDFSIGFFDNDSLLNLSQQWYEGDTCSDLPVPQYTKKMHPPDDLSIASVSSEECIDMVLNELTNSDNNVVHKKAHWWNPKAISMNAMQKPDENSIVVKGNSDSLHKYNRYFRKTFHCHVCSEKFTKFNDLITHDSTIHTDMPKDHCCQKCGKLFLSDGRLKVHEEIHRVKSFQCQLCQKMFTRRKTLDRHLNVHIGSYSCLKCNFKAPDMRNLKIHESTHSLVKKHLCNQCDKQFSTQSSLRRHDRLVHKKSFLFRCDQCDYSTIQPSNLKYHKSSHDPQTFICDHCGSSFKNQALFKKHSKTHEGNLFNCDHCSKMFRRKESLLQHLFDIHSLGTRVTHKCEVCQRCFSKKKILEAHKIKFHPT